MADVSPNGGLGDLSIPKRITDAALQPSVPENSAAKDPEALEVGADGQGVRASDKKGRLKKLKVR